MHGISSSVRRPSLWFICYEFIVPLLKLRVLPPSRSASLAFSIALYSVNLGCERGCASARHSWVVASLSVGVSPTPIWAILLKRMKLPSGALVGSTWVPLGTCTTFIHPWKVISRALLPRGYSCQLTVLRAHRCCSTASKSVSGVCSMINSS